MKITEKCKAYHEDKYDKNMTYTYACLKTCRLWARLHKDHVARCFVELKCVPLETIAEVLPRIYNKFQVVFVSVKQTKTVCIHMYTG